MPRKTTRKPSPSNAFFPKPKRGRPRKFVAPDALCFFEKQRITTGNASKIPKEDLKPEVEKSSSRRMNPTTSDRCYTSDEVEFMNALSEFKRASGRTFPTCSEILGILRGLGYAKISTPDVFTSRPMA